jgi:hypothetical protein
MFLAGGLADGLGRFGVGRGQRGADLLLHSRHRAQPHRHPENSLQDLFDAPFAIVEGAAAVGHDRGQPSAERVGADRGRDRRMVERAATQRSIVKGGQPYRTREGEGLRIIFAPLDPPTRVQYDCFAAAYNPDDGNFQVLGKDGQGLPPGKYRISLQLSSKKEDL